MAIFIATAIAILLVAGIFKSLNDHKILNDQRETFTGSHAGWDTFVSPHNKGVISINRSAGKVALGKLPDWKEYEISQIASVEVLRDGASITSTDRGSQAAGALLGGLALGGVGLLLGGLSGSKTNRATIQSVAIKVIVDDNDLPVHVTEFFKSPSKKGTDARSFIIKPSLEKADHFHALLVNALRSSQKAGEHLKLDSADQIRKLWELKQAGALTEEEFASQKARLLSLVHTPSTDLR